MKSIYYYQAESQENPNTTKVEKITTQLDSLIEEHLKALTKLTKAYKELIVTPDTSDSLGYKKPTTGLCLTYVRKFLTWRSNLQRSEKTP